MLPKSLKSLASALGSRLDPDAVNPVDHGLIQAAWPIFKALRRYFRAEVHGLENMPEGPALLVGNHNAGITFLEPFFLGMAWYEKMEGEDTLRPLAHDIMVKLPFVGNLLMGIGSIRAAHATADEALAQGQKVLVFPGGNYEAFRAYRERHKVDFGGHAGFAKLAIRNQTPIVPVLSLGGHETFFVLWRGEKLAKLTGTKRFLRSESFPIFLGLPWGVGFGPLFHLPLPAKALVEVGAPISLEGYPPEAAEDRDKVKALAAQVEAKIQEMMDARAEERRWPIIG